MLTSTRRHRGATGTDQETATAHGRQAGGTLRAAAPALGRLVLAVAVAVAAKLDVLTAIYADDVWRLRS
jgi:hypothetical protein